MKKVLTLILAVLTLGAAHGQIKPKQSLRISITGVPTGEKARLDAIYPVSTDGYIEMWHIGKVKVAGYREAQVASMIAEKFRASQIYSNPVFQVMNPTAEEEKRRKEVLAENQKVRRETVIEDTKKYTIGGQVKAAGERQWTEGMTLYTAVQSAGGETPYGAINRVKLYRNGQVYTYNLKIDKHKGVKIYPKDLIEVPQKTIIGR